MAKLKGLWWLIGVALALAGAGWIASQFANGKADAATVASAFKERDEHLGRIDGQVGEIKVQARGVETEVKLFHDDLRTVNRNIDTMNQNLLMFGRGYKPNLTLTPLVEPKK